MPPEPLRCRHLHADGRQCGSPALRHEKLCYQHHATARPRRDPLGLPLLPDPEDLSAVQRGLAELLRLVARELIDDKHAKRLFALLTAAGTNLARIDRNRRASRELDLRARSLALAEARFHAQNPQAGHPTEAGCPILTTASPSLGWASTNPESPITEPVHDPELGLIAPGPAPEPRPEPVSDSDPARLCRHPERSEGPRESPPRHNLAPFQPPPPPERPTRARQAEIDAQAKIEVDFQRGEEENRMQRQRLRVIAREVIYPHLSPAARAKEDALRAEEAAYWAEPDTPIPTQPL